MKKNNRPKVPQNTVTKVLTKSGRRCALCFGLEGDGHIKEGQVAHLDRKRENNQEDNLAYLCLRHHDLYDTKTSQSKGYTQAEVKEYRDRLYQAIENGILKKVPAQTLDRQSKEVIEHDKKIFEKANELLPEEIIKSFLSNLICDHSYYLLESEVIDDFIKNFKKTGNYFLNEDLDNLREDLITLLYNLSHFLASEFFRYPEKQTGNTNIKYCLRPDWHLERGLPSEDNFSKYSELRITLESHCDKVSEKYKEYRLQIKKILML